MRILTSSWQGGYLDYAMLPGHYRISVRLWSVLRAVDDLYWVPARDWRLVMNYVNDVGVLGAIGKAHSRLSERARNAKYVACGVGVIDAPGSDDMPLGTQVMFLAPAHPMCVERVVVPAELVRPLAEGSRWRDLKPGEVLLMDSRGANACPEAESVAGWSYFSGEPLRDEVCWSALESARLHLESLSRGDAQILPGEGSEVAELVRGREVRASMRACLVGYGHYARTRLVPALSPQISVQRVHEIDPVQLGASTNRFDRDTAPDLRADENFDVYFVAGYHHTHAPIAIDALDRGASAVVEKPIATTMKQLQSLLAAMEGTRGRLFSGYHRRYSELTERARQDLGEGAISYHCIVHEVKLPQRHWYLWPNSGTRMVSNGCHWVDHFLYINDFAEPVRWGAWRAANGDVMAFAELANGASFSMALTDQGSSRLGVEDTVEMRRGDITVRITNDTGYQAENSRRVLRRMRINRLTSYGRMYAEISRKLLTKEPGEDSRSVRISTGLTLHLQEALRTTAAEVSA